MPDPNLTLTIGSLLGCALVGGILGDWLRIPKVTSYLLVGVVVGPQMLHWIAEEQIPFVDPLTRLAISLVLFNLGCHFPLSWLRRYARRVLRLSLGELTATFVLVLGGLLLVGATWQTALLLASLALATAPATTILVLKEAESEGPITEYANALVAVNNLVCIVAFELFFLLVQFSRGRLEVAAGDRVWRMALDLLGSFGLGITAGVIISFAFSQVAKSRQLVLLIAISAILQGLCMLWSLPYMLAFLTMGAVVANLSDRTGEILGTLDRITGLLCVVFFVVHGAEIDLYALPQVGLLGAAYIFFRFAGKYLGIYASAREPTVKKYLGTSLVAQAGAAIALVQLAVDRDPELGIPLQTVILGTVVVFELIGPLLIRWSVLRGGEIPLAHVLHHKATTPWEEVQGMWNRLRTALGWEPATPKSQTALTVNHLVRKTVKGVPQSCTFDELMEHVEHTHEDTYAIVSGTEELVGIIRYTDLSKALFHHDLGRLLVAADLAVPPDAVLFPDDSAQRARQLFAQANDDCIPVISREAPHRYLGMVRRRDLTKFARRGQLDEQTPATNPSVAES